MDPLKVSFLTSFVVFLLAVYSCSLSIHLLLNRFNIVVANIEMWTINNRPTTRTIRPSDWNSKRLSYLTSVAREETSDSIQVIETAADFIHNYRTLNVRML